MDDIKERISFYALYGVFDQLNKQQMKSKEYKNKLKCHQEEIKNLKDINSKL